MEPQMNADERRLNGSAEKVFKVAFEVSNILDKNFFEKVYYKKQSGIKLKSQIQETIDKSSAINLRLSAFICGLYKFGILIPHKHNIFNYILNTLRSLRCMILITTKST